MSDELAPELLPPASHAPLRDPVRSAELVDAGWTRVRLLDPAAAASLREAYGEVHGWDGQGFDPDPGNVDIAYRERVSAILTRALAEPLDELFDGWRPFLRSYYTKWPGSDSIHVHWDWTCVDEAAGERTYQVWIALQDVTADNGLLWMLPRSHRVDHRPRGTNLGLPLSPELLARGSDIRDHLVPVPLQAGEAVIFDMGLVHVSSPNVTSDPRVAIVVALHRDDARMRYYRRAEDGQVDRFDVDAKWFNEAVATVLEAQPPSMEPIERVVVGASETVGRRLDVLLAHRDARAGGFPDVEFLTDPRSQA